MMNYKRIKRALKERAIKRIPEDLYIKRLRSLAIGEGMLHEGNIYLMDYAIQQMPKAEHLIEIGSYGGLSTSLIIHLLKKHGRTEKVINCDPWIYEGFEDASGKQSATIDGREDVSRAEYSDYMKTAFINNMQFLNKGNLPFTFQLYSDEFFESYAAKKIANDIFGRSIQLGSSISFAYIDGLHSYDQTKKDFENIDLHLLKSGFILFDDTIEGESFGSNEFMKEMYTNKNYQLVDKNPNHLFKKIA